MNDAESRWQRSLAIEIAAGTVALSLSVLAHRLVPPAAEPFTPTQPGARGMSDPASRPKPPLARALRQPAVADGIPLRAVVADSCDGETAGGTTGRAQRGVGSVRALRPSPSRWAVAGPSTALADAAAAAVWDGPAAAAAWQAVARAVRDGQTEPGWARVIGGGPSGPDRRPRAVVAPTDPASLPEHSTWYRRTHLPAPHTAHHPRPGGGGGAAGGGPRRGRAPLRAAPVGGAERQARQTGARLERRARAAGSGAAPPLGAGVRRLPLRLGGAPRGGQRPGRGAGARAADRRCADSGGPSRPRPPAAGRRAAGRWRGGAAARPRLAGAVAHARARRARRARLVGGAATAAAPRPARLARTGPPQRPVGPLVAPANTLLVILAGGLTTGKRWVQLIPSHVQVSP